MEIQDLTKVEEQIMQVLWRLKKAFVKEIVSEFPDPKPAYTTTSTIIRILESKGFIGHHAYGRTHQYHPLISKETYKEYETSKLLDNYYGNSAKSMFSFFVKEEKLDMKDMEEILQMINNIKNNPK
jgi:BlaI family penicillinase repressor